jgi:anti-anti-sigma regulatory factor
MTIYTAAELKSQLLKALDECAEIEIDLAEVSELDTAGFQQLYLAKREASRRGRSLRLVAHSDATREVLDLYHMGGYFGDPVLIPGETQPTSPQRK